MTRVLGFDVGGSAIKFGVVDVAHGCLAGELGFVPTPNPATPRAVAQCVARVLSDHSWNGSVGCALPAVIKDGFALTAAHIDPGWIGCDAAHLMAQHCGREVVLLNDADAAGLAEMEFGAGKNQAGTVILLTFGTGIGSALFLDGRLWPNTELGHLQIDGLEAEERAAARIRTDHKLSLEAWAMRADQVLQACEALFCPDLFILGGGISRDHAQYLHLFSVQATVRPAHFLDSAGVVGSAWAANCGF